MPFKSEAQRRKFLSDPKLRKYVSEWEKDTPRKLPSRVKPKAHHSQKR